MPEPANPQSFNRYSYVYNNSINLYDPDGHCPKPKGKFAKANVICIAGFIPTKTSSGGFVTFVGDDRDFSSDSTDGSSRFYLWVNVDDGTSVADVHRTETATGPNGDATGDYWEPRPFEPTGNPWDDWVMGYNGFKVELHDDGAITLRYHVICSHPACNNALAPDGRITFTPNDYGTFDASGYVNQFPALEAYHWDNGQLQNDYLFRFQPFADEAIDSGHLGLFSSFGMAQYVYIDAQFYGTHRPQVTVWRYLPSHSPYQPGWYQPTAVD